VIVDHDLHIHTTLSACCTDQQCTPANIIDRAAGAGLKTIGFANHVWDSAVPGGGQWYRKQSLRHILQIRRQIPDDTRGLRVLVGCECEYCGDGKVSITPASAEQLDYVLVPISHFHIEPMVKPADVNTPKEMAALLIQRFREAIELEIATGIAHPLLAHGYERQCDEILSHICEGELLDAFGRAAELGVSIEVHFGMFPGAGKGETEGFHDETFLRVLSLAKQAGCCFHFASDAHHLENVTRAVKLEPYARAIGITPDDILPLLRK